MVPTIDRLGFGSTPASLHPISPQLTGLSDLRLYPELHQRCIATALCSALMNDFSCSHLFVSNRLGLRLPLSRVDTSNRTPEFGFLALSLPSIRRRPFTRENKREHVHPDFSRRLNWRDLPAQSPHADARSLILQAAPPAGGCAYSSFWGIRFTP